MSSPRSWGCFQPVYTRELYAGVFPTLVGVFPVTVGMEVSSTSLPHARGGVSLLPQVNAVLHESSPRSWGCFLRIIVLIIGLIVFPTLVGVFLPIPFTRPEPIQSSPRSWGCFIIPVLSEVEHIRLPHARGGVSLVVRTTILFSTSSPRSWGCFYCRLARSHGPSVFPTLVGVFLFFVTGLGFGIGLPHARGGVSWCRSSRVSSTRSSPRSWGCFREVMVCSAEFAVFPTLVGVFLSLMASHVLCGGLPHARGGVSHHRHPHYTDQQSSPRSWGCFRLQASCPVRSRVFPTLVGVFLYEIYQICCCLRLPHARGGVSIPVMK